MGVFGGQPVVGLEPRAPFAGQFGQGALHLCEKARFELQRRQVGVREVAVVVGLLLVAHRARGIQPGVVQPGFLGHRAAFAEHLALAPDFTVQGAFHEAERVEVLDFRARAQLPVLGLLQRNIGIAAHRSFLHRTVTDADPGHQLMNAAHAGAGFLGRAQLRLGDDFQKRGAGPVEVHAGGIGQGLVQRLSGILLQVGAGQFNPPGWRAG